MDVVLLIIPFLWMVSTSLKAPNDLLGTHWIPRRLAFENYRDAFSFGLWGRWTMNTII